MKHLRATIALFAVVGAAGGAARSAPDIDAPRWLRVPSTKQVAAHYPKAAIAWNVNARVRLRCTVNADGTLGGCTVPFVAPRGYGFTQAALEVAPGFRMSPTTPDGKSVAGGVVVIPIEWRISDVAYTPVFEVGDDALLVTYLRPGEPATDSTNRVFACAAPGDRGRRCEGHPLGWRERPTNEAVWRLISATRLGDRQTRLDCAVDSNGALADCRVGGEATPQEEAAMRALARDMKPEPAARDGASVQSGRITLFFDWPRLKFVTGPPDSHPPR